MVQFGTVEGRDARYYNEDAAYELAKIGGVELDEWVFLEDRLMSLREAFAKYSPLGTVARLVAEKYDVKPPSLSESLDRNVPYHHFRDKGSDESASQSRPRFLRIFSFLKSWRSS